MKSSAATTSNVSPAADVTLNGAKGTACFSVRSLFANEGERFFFNMSDSTPLEYS